MNAGLCTVGSTARWAKTRGYPAPYYAARAQDADTAVDSAVSYLLASCLNRYILFLQRHTLFSHLVLAKGKVLTAALMSTVLPTTRSNSERTDYSMKYTQGVTSATCYTTTKYMKKSREGNSLRVCFTRSQLEPLFGDNFT